MSFTPCGIEVIFKFLLCVFFKELLCSLSTEIHSHLDAVFFFFLLILFFFFFPSKMEVALTILLRLTKEK